MESSTWAPGIISRSKVGDGEELKNMPWSLAYFNEDCFMFPKELWERMSQTIRVYGEIVPVIVDTEFGKKQCFIKVRAAAYLQ